MNSFVLLKQKGGFKRIKIQSTFKDMDEVLEITPINKNNLSPQTLKKFKDKQYFLTWNTTVMILPTMHGFSSASYYFLLLQE